MANFIANKEFLHDIMLFYFHIKYCATRCFNRLKEIYGKNAPTKRLCKKKFEIFKRGNYQFEYDEDENSKSSSSEVEEVENVKEKVTQVGTSNDHSDCEELKILSQFLKHSYQEILKKSGLQGLSKDKRQICETLLHYHNIKTNNDKATKSEQSLVKIYGNHNLAVKTCKNLLNQIKRCIDFENVVLPKTIRNLGLVFSLQTPEEEEKEEEVTLPIYFSHESKNKMLIEKNEKKNDYRIVKIRKVLVPSPKKRFLRKLLLHFFILREIPFMCHKKLFDVYGDQAPSEKTIKKWFRRFGKGIYELNDEKRSGRAKKFEDEKMKMLLNDKSVKSQREIANMLSVTPSTISHRLKKSK